MTEQEAQALLTHVFNTYSTIICKNFKDDGKCIQEAFEMAINALEIQIKKEPIMQQGNPLFGYCPKCGSAVYQWLNRLACKECLQGLKWPQK